ncbi:MAG: XdhC family protein [Steroidobacteraceae bacterium]
MTAGPQSWLPTVIGRVAQAPAVVRVVVAQVQGSTPREPGAYMLVDAAGLTGTVGGGRLEWRPWRRHGRCWRGACARRNS